MARLPRLVVEGQLHHVLQRSRDRRVVWHHAEDFLAALRALRQAAARHAVALHAYVLLPDHLHLVVTPANAAGFSRFLRAVLAPVTRRHHAQQGRAEALWEGRSRTVVVEEAQHGRELLRYVELNPVRAGLVTDPTEYPWTSLRHHVGLATEPGLTDPPGYWALGNTPFERQRAYLAWLEAPQDPAALLRLRGAVQGGWPLGSPAFIEALQAKAGRALRPKKPGRPKKSGIVDLSPN